MSRAKDIYERIKLKNIDAITEFIESRESENLFMDFKRAANNGTDEKFHNDDRKNLAKAISGFANSEGGVIVWGIDCRKNANGADVAGDKFPIADVKKFISFIEGAISGCTLPPCIGIENFPIEVNAGSGFVATFIPKSPHAPHQVVKDFKYYMRAGSDFLPVPHGVLAGMFGKRPGSKIFNLYNIAPAKINQNRIIKIEFGIVIHNAGPGIASDIFLNVDTHDSPGINCNLSVSTKDTNWRGYQSFGRMISLITNPDVKLPPESQSQPITLALELLPPFTKPIKISGICGASNSVSCRFIFENSQENINRLYNKAIAETQIHQNNENYYHEVAENILNISEPNDKGTINL